MDATQILNQAERCWPFTPEKYPLLKGSEDSAEVFIATHILKHQAKSVLWCLQTGKRGSAVKIHYKDFVIRVRKLLFNSFRFAAVVKLPPAEVEQILQSWSHHQGGGASDVLISEALVFSRPFRKLAWLFRKISFHAMTGTEFADHGESLNLEALHTSAAAFLITARDMAVTLNYPRAEFEEWLQKHPVV